MRTVISAAVALAVPAFASAAHAEEGRPDRRWELDLRASYVVLGGAVQTGGVMPQLAARHTWPVYRWLDVHVGGQIGAFGFADESRWLGVLGGLQAGAYVRPTTLPLRLGLTFVADGGRIPVCNDWGLCLRHNGFFPAGVAEAAYYADKAVAGGASLSVRVVNTAAWGGPSAEGGAFLRAHW